MPHHQHGKLRPAPTALQPVHLIEGRAQLPHLKALERQSKPLEYLAVGNAPAGLGAKDQQGFQLVYGEQRHPQRLAQHGRARYRLANMSTGQFPATRMRRLRASAWSRNLVAETRLSPADLIWPMFVREGEGIDEPITTMPGVSRHSIDRLPDLARQAEALGIPCIALFPYTPAGLRTPGGTEALNPDNLVCRALRAIKASGANVGLLTDIALDPYTSHGHDGLLHEDGRILNDDTNAMLVQQALNQARAGADIVAPSDMMDGRVAAIRAGLEADGFHDVQIMAYAAKYASGFYGPFRDAVGAGGYLKGDKKTYQMDPRNAREALREVALDISEGADSVMVKPGLPYLDIVAAAAARFDVPVFAYCVSGEYAMLEAAAAAGMLDRQTVVMETLGAFKRAGAAGILTYHAPFAAQLLAVAR